MQAPPTCPYCGAAQPPPHLSPSGPGICAQCGRPLAATGVAPGRPPAPPAPAVAPGRPSAPPVPYAEPLGPDEWGEGPRGELPPLPTLARAAGIIWVVFGGLILLNFAATVLIALAFTPRVAEGVVVAAVLCVGVVAALFAGAFIYVGVQTLTGMARDTLGNSIGSLIFGALVVAAAFNPQARGGLEGAPRVIGMMINVLCGGGLITAGVLALIDRDKYRMYRRARAPRPEPPPGRRRDW